MAVNTIDPTKPILGYALKQRIGIGGFGEVWAAEAPGGLPKAVKFIFGYHDEKRAQAELKALNRIRDVRHPFLLSLERIDIVDGQMVVITELADMCLKTRFEQCVQSGLKGIPRTELLGYLRDAANALDYISEEFQLQHLDVKPENLLMVSGHVKVADFGLVKDIHDGTQSLMSGLTPAYAPPELFDGRPSKHSDQYSLAILYQELLTGVRPFDGTNAAQLASQHINERPLLKSLPRDDQAIISRALSKDPENRFPTCAAMVEQLATEKSHQQGAPKPRTRTKLRDGRRKRRSRSTPSSTISMENTRAFAHSPRDVTKLDHLDFEPKEAKFRPTLLVGIGGTGVRILRKIRKKISQRDGEPHCFPAIRFFGLDTDASDLFSSCGTSAADELRANEIFPLPLRKPEEYRVDAKMHLSWLSRRWIYNVPKTLKTEGIRPLGRLAFATHIDDLSIRLRQVISELVQTENLAQTAANLDLDPIPQPRIVLAGSISGGTCSGMAIDVAYAIRAILRELGVLDEDVIGLFTHSTSGVGKQRELVIANALVFLNELYHFSCVEEYPGDETCMIPPSTDGTTTFASTYLAHLGDDLSKLEYEDHVDALAEYIYLNTATPCGSFFDACRWQEIETTGLPLRSLGICRSVGSHNDIGTSSSELLASNVLKTWTDPEWAAGFDPKAVAHQRLTQVTAQTDQLLGFVHEAVQHVLPDAVMQVARPLVECFNEQQREQSYRAIVESVLGIFGSFPGASEEKRQAKLITAMEKLRHHFVGDRMPRLIDKIAEIVDLPGPRLSGAQAVKQEIANRLRDQSAELGCMIAKSSEDIVALLRRVLSPGGVNRDSVPEFAEQLAEALLQRFTLEWVQALTDSLRPFTQEIEPTLEQIADQLDRVVSRRDPPSDTSRQPEFAGDDLSELFVNEIRTRLAQRLPTLRDRVEQQLQHNFLDQSGGFRAVLADPELRYELMAQVDEAARATITEQLKELPLEECFSNAALSVETFAEWMVEQSLPHLLDCGGAIRLACATPDRAKSFSTVVDEFAKQTEQRPNVIPATSGELVLCTEVEGIPLDNIAMHLIHGRPDSLEFASRLHARTDIAWTHISAMR